jgi:hypothetical protein
MIKTSKLKLRTLKAKIKGLANESTQIRFESKSFSGSYKNKSWIVKKQVGFVTRLHLLAYAILRGVPRKVVEPTTNKEFDVYLMYEASTIYDIVQQHSFYGGGMT